MAASLSFDVAFRQIRRGEPAPLYYLTGDEEVLKDELLECLVDRVVDPAARDFNFDVRAAGDLDGESLHALVETPPMLASRRLVIVKGLEQWRRNARVWKVLERYVEAPSPTTVLVIVHGPGQKADRTLTKHAVHIHLDPLEPARTAKWVEHRAGQAGIEFTADAARHLIEATGGDLSVMAREIEKLAAATTQGGTVGTDHVAALVGIHRGHTANDWVAAVVRRDFAHARHILGPVLASSGTNGVRLMADMGQALLGLRLARALRERGTSQSDIQKTLVGKMRDARLYRLSSWGAVASTWVPASEQWTDDQLTAALRAAQRADAALKSTTLSDDMACIALFLIELDALRVAA
jgi:DNA polymerase III subunit delta